MTQIKCFTNLVSELSQMSVFWQTDLKQTQNRDNSLSFEKGDLKINDIKLLITPQKQQN